MDHVLVLFMLLWSSGFSPGLPIVENDAFKEAEDIRLVEGCSGELQVKREGEWKGVDNRYWDLTLADVVCRHLDCGSAVQTSAALPENYFSTLKITPSCLQSEHGLRKCLTKRMAAMDANLEINCTDSVRLVDGTGLCSGRLEVKQSNQSWSSVCEDDFDQQDAEVVCRQLGCGAPSVLQGALYGEVEAPVWTKEFQCGGHESALLDCRSSDRNTCSSGKAVGLTCSEPKSLRLVGGSSQCAGELEAKAWGMWDKVDDDRFDWNLKTADVVCRHLDCGSAVSTGRRMIFIHAPVWRIKSTCLQSKSAVRECILTRADTSQYNLEITCSDSVQLVDGTGPCSGRLEVKQSDQSWSSVCEDDFDQQDAEVVCRQLGCGAPSVLQGALYGEVEAPVWTKEFQCGGNESALLDCRSSDRNTCSSGKAVGLTCSEPDDVRLVGGASHCVGRLEVKHKGDWRPADHDYNWNLMSAAVVCRQLDCGSALSTGRRDVSDFLPGWIISSSCGQSETAIRECTSLYSLHAGTLEVNCSDSVKLVDGNSRCSGRLEVRSNHSNQSWSSVCEDDFDQQDAEVACRQLGCGAPSVLQGALYGEVEAPVWTKEFQCGGHESALLDCRSSDRNTCSSGKAVGLTCSEPDNIRLFGGTSRCDGTLQMKQLGEWRPVFNNLFLRNQWSGSAVCTRLDCGSAVLTEVKEDTQNTAVWFISDFCVRSDLILQECLNIPFYSGSAITLKVVCSDLLVQPNISASPSTDTVYKAKQQELWVLMGSNFTLSCSIEPQYPGGFFQLVSTTSNTIDNSTLPAVNHSAHFLFSAADHTHRGEYRCVYHLHVFSHNFSSESQPLYLIPAAPVTELIIRIVVHVLVMSVLITALCCTSKATRNLKNPEI